MREITVGKFTESMAAHLARIQLETEGIEAWLDNENFASVYPVRNGIVGGIQLKVWEPDAPRAAEIIQRLDNDAQEDREAAYRACPQCGSTNLSPALGFLPLLLLTFLTLGMYHMFKHRPCKCNTCGHRW